MIYVVYCWEDNENNIAGDPGYLNIGIVTTDKEVAEKFIEQRRLDKGYKLGKWHINELEDGEEWPTW